MNIVGDNNTAQRRSDFPLAGLDVDDSGGRARCILCANTLDVGREIADLVKGIPDGHFQSAFAAAFAQANADVGQMACRIGEGYEVLCRLRQ